ncbi:hypothetical protein H0H92_004169 [Tricholoma furcatifolium]|nr:hypothetical protein H0H92_004169 [Tricholoma furcatifolium]
MFRVAIGRSVRAASRQSYLLVSRPSFALQARFESNGPPPPKIRTPEQQAKKDALDRRDEIQRDWDAKIITYAELKPRTESPVPETYLIDVREPDEVIQGMIPSAVNLPLTVLGNSLHLDSTAFLEKHGFEKPSKDQQVIFYCRSGMRSTTASDVAKRNGYTNILNYKGSWLEWVEKENIKK